MSKRKDPETPSKAQSTPSKKRRTADAADGSEDTAVADALDRTPSKARQNPGGSQEVRSNGHLSRTHAALEMDTASTPRRKGTALFTTPRRSNKDPRATPSKSAKADRSAKRKSAQTLIDAAGDDDDWDNSNALARAILGENDNVLDSTEQGTEDALPTTVAATALKQGRGRPKGAKNKRSPTPEGDLPPEERYFFQNRMGPPKVSSNIFSSVGLLNHDEYFELFRDHKDTHESERSYLSRLHARSFPQWQFELDQGFGLCLYGYGSKRTLVNNFIEWFHPKLDGHAQIVVVNGYTPRINLRAVLRTIASALIGSERGIKLVGQPHDMIDTILSHLSDHVDARLVIVVHSIDAAPLRRTATQSLLARLASHSRIAFVATADTPNFPILWSSALKDQFRFLYHDCTTFAPYELEINPVDDVNELLGRKSRRIGGKEGIEFVLRSLPDNARNLYRVLLTEILAVINDGLIGDGEDEYNENPNSRKLRNENVEDVGIEYRTLYQKASEEFICSSDMNFRFLLKEFHDHQMLTSRRDASGTELLGVPLSREELESVLEDLVLA